MKNIFIAFTLVMSSTVLAQNWTTYKNNEFNFSVELPSEPKFSAQDIPTEVGDLTMSMFIVDASANENTENLMYMIIHTKYPVNPDKLEESDVQIMLDGSVNGAVSNVQGKLIYANKVELNGIPGREAKIEIKGALMYMNMFVKEDALYAIQTICLIENDENEDIMKFFNSFKLN